jgi:hypothetical protein
MSRTVTPWLDSLEDVRMGLVELVEAVRDGADIDRCQEMRFLYMAIGDLLQDRRDAVAKAEIERMTKQRLEGRLQALGRPTQALDG